MKVFSGVLSLVLISGVFTPVFSESIAAYCSPTELKQMGCDNGDDVALLACMQERSYGLGLVSKKCKNWVRSQKKSDKPQIVLPEQYQGTWHMFASSKDGGETWNTVGQSEAVKLVIALPGRFVFSPDKAGEKTEAIIKELGTLEVKGQKLITIRFTNRNDTWAISGSPDDATVYVISGEGSAMNEELRFKIYITK